MIGKICQLVRPGKGQHRAQHISGRKACQRRQQDRIGAAGLIAAQLLYDFPGRNKPQQQRKQQHPALTMGSNIAEIQYHAARREGYRQQFAKACPRQKALGYGIPRRHHAQHQRSLKYQQRPQGTAADDCRIQVHGIRRGKQHGTACDPLILLQHEIPLTSRYRSGSQSRIEGMLSQRLRSAS